jgi:hypothetical protein
VALPFQLKDCVILCPLFRTVQDDVSLVLLSDRSQSNNNLKPIYARSGWEIPQEKLEIFHIRKLKRELVRIRSGELLRQHPRATLRSVSEYPYNCVGLVFATRRAVIDIENVPKILEEDGYHLIQRNDVFVGDVVLYGWNNTLSHVALITQIERYMSTINIKVLSRWGFDGEFEHFIEDVPETYGQPIGFYTERVL